MNLPLSPEAQDAIVDSMNQAVARADEAGRQKRPLTKADKLRYALTMMGGETPNLTEHDRAVMRTSTWFIACAECQAITPCADPDPGDWMWRDHCPRCQKGFFASLKCRKQLGLFENPYLDTVLALFKGEGQKRIPGLPYINIFASRELLTDRFAWAIPDEQTISAIAKYGPILEIGAGRGYWAWCLTQIGCKVAAYDIKPPPNHWHAENEHTFVEVCKGGPEVVRQKQFRDHTLFLCWPPLSDKMAFNALQNFRGEHLLYIGEPGDGCTADRHFNSRLARDWEEIDDSDHPQYGGIHDRLMIFKRK